ncbi:HelD family protein [Marinilabilia salmonicolor]|uniref:HelD family protein n=1 Tax=Marinilabilia salmonicolor TaxID=989 RepID=UPI00029A4FA6|nr:UvrD-helicase domain-containing protein [Marinilabilia salmonicolor]
MFNQTEKEERSYLEEVKEKLQTAIDRIDKNVQEYAKEVQAQKDYLWEHKTGMDHVEKVAVHQSVRQSSLTGEAAVEKKKRLRKLMQSPWFGRFDFKEQGAQKALPVYVGVHPYYDEEQKDNLVYDWRAPVSSMFYDFELGAAYYEAPSGKVEGEITLKRQFRIRFGEMEYMLESSLNIHDEVLQRELGKASDDKMKHIVATIQRDQNAIIRNEDSRVLIIQGVAGSGKTSIALHRIAFLLYRFRESISSKDILILSPNKVFADYISNVLPELGEERIPEIGMEELAHQLLDKKVRFQTFFEQVSLLLEKEDEEFRNRIQFKSTFEFVNKLNEYLTYIENNYFEPEMLMVQRNPIPDSYISDKFKSLHRVPIFSRFNEIVSHIERDVLFFNQYEITGKERNELRKKVKNMFRITNLRELYKDFYQWLGESEMFKYARASIFEYPDVFPLTYMKLKLEGFKSFSHVKHLLVDEMQDYTPVQYAVLSRLLPCKKTILGDANQSVNPFSSSNSDAIAKVFPGADCMLLNKSYRSTSEIARFAQKIRPDSDLEVVERHGEAPSVECFKTRRAQTDRIKAVIDKFEQSDYHSLGIVCKTQKQAARIYKSLEDSYDRILLLTAETGAFGQGVVVTSSHMAKGLEFDQVIIPDADADNYNNEVDRGLLYIACTRAMHHLNLMYVKEKSPLLLD